MKVNRFIAFFHFIYVFITGMWPLVSIHTFMMVTGPKTDIWLVKMVGLLTAGIGMTLLYCFSRHYYKAMTVLALLSSASYLGVDVFYALNGTIRKIYLADAALQITFIYNYLWVWFHAGARLRAGGKL